MTLRALMQLFKKLSAGSGRMSRGARKKGFDKYYQQVPKSSHPGTPTGVKGDMPGVTSKNLANLGEIHPQWAKLGITPKYPYLGKFDPRLDSPQRMLRPMSTKKAGPSGYADESSAMIKEIQKRYSGGGPNFPTRGTPSGTFTPGSPEWRRVMERKVKDKVARIDRRNRARDSISAMRKDPGIGTGLQKLDSRAYSALNTGGRGAMGTGGRSAKPARPLQYESNPANTFTNLMRTDRGFQRFVLDQVGPEKVSTVLLNPEIRRRLMSDYFRAAPKNRWMPDLKGAKEIDDAWSKHLDDLYAG